MSVCDKFICVTSNDSTPEREFKHSIAIVSVRGEKSPVKVVGTKMHR